MYPSGGLGRMLTMILSTDDLIQHIVLTVHGGEPFAGNPLAFLINSVHPTDFRKEPPGGMVDHRYLDPEETPATEQPPDSEEIARRLSEETW